MTQLKYSENAKKALLKSSNMIDGKDNLHMHYIEDVIRKLKQYEKEGKRVSKSYYTTFHDIQVKTFYSDNLEAVIAEEVIQFE